MRTTNTPTAATTTHAAVLAVHHAASTASAGRLLDAWQHANAADATAYGRAVGYATASVDAVALGHTSGDATRAALADAADAATTAAACLLAAYGTVGHAYAAWQQAANACHTAWRNAPSGQRL